MDLDNWIYKVLEGIARTAYYVQVTSIKSF